jgi:RNA polymerase sigma-70 factor (ECF subfamily)
MVSAIERHAHRLDDVALVARARNGDLEATQMLLERHQQAAYTAALRLLGEPADAEDVTQDALVRAYTRLPELADGASFPAWLRKISVNLSLNVLRRRGLLHFEPLAFKSHAHDGGREIERDFADDETVSPEAIAMNVALRDEIDTLVRTLPPEQRVAVVLRDMYDYDVAEVAALQRCGISAAKMRISRGRAQLKQLIIKAGIRPPEAGARG